MIGEQIKKRREELKLSQDELAKRMGYKSRSSINKIELGIQDVSQKKIPKFAKELDVSIGYLMEDGKTIKQESETSSYSEYVSEKLKIALEEAGMTPYELSVKIDEPIDIVMDAYNGIDRGFRIDVMYKICDVLKKPYGYFTESLEYVENMGINLHYLRLIAGKTKEEIAEYFGYSIEQVDEVENGFVQPHFSTIEKVSKLFNIPIRIIIGTDFKKHQVDRQLEYTIKMLAHTDIWMNNILDFDFSVEELNQIVQYAKFIQMQRK